MSFPLFFLAFFGGDRKVTATMCLSNVSQKGCDYTSGDSHGVYDAREGKTPTPAHQNPSATDNRISFNNSGVGQSLLLSVKEASAQPRQLTALMGSIHVTDKYFLAQFTFLTQRRQQPSKQDFVG